MRKAAGPRIHAVVLAGGAGTRFWPLSREARPKPMLRVADGSSTLLEATVARARAFAPASRTWLVCGREHARPMGRLARIPAARTRAEPRMRNTAAAVALAAERIAASDPDAVLAILSADHRIPDRRAFAAAIRRAARAASRQDVMVTLGVQPTRPDPAYGYIRLGAALPKPDAGLHAVSRFIEKPDRARAQRYLASGRYRWNAGVFVFRARVLLDELARHAPDVHGALAPVRAVPASGRGLAGAIEQAYRRMPALPIDKAVMERSRSVWCLPVTFRWSDVGTWRSLAEELGVGPNVTQVIDGEALLCDSTGNLVRGHDRPVVLLGVEGLAVIDAGDALLVASLERSGDVREVVSRLRKTGRSDLL